ncbi:MAG TPA: pirin family protein [Fibrobacteria bacterium]|nr:pirin family protein [Fibrobacteria bacterium]
MSTQVATKKVSGILRNNQMHWVGDGFPVRTLFAYNAQGNGISPFLMLDYGKGEFPPTQERKGVGEHPHRGFETVTIVYEGSVEHRDSGGGGGAIGRGDVQWMTAASGVVHEEFHGQEFAREGGAFEMAQLWVNLPAKSKMTKPRYQEILDAQIPVVTLPNDAGTARVIAGEYAGKKGPALTFSRLNVWDVRLKAGASAEFSVEDGDTVILPVFGGSVRVNGTEAVKDAEAALFDQAGSSFMVENTGATEAKILFLSGAPLNEPIAGYGPFVMNTQEEIFQAVRDYQSGKMGRLN